MESAQVVIALDSGALILAEKDERIETVIRKWLREGATIVIPAVVLAEVIRGQASDAVVNRIVRAVDRVLPVDEAAARDAGARLAPGGSDTVDALVVATAERNGATDILTTDSRDIRKLASPRVNVIGL